MAVRFIIGRAGTGKSKHCLDRVVTLLKTDPLGPPIYWIVPRQSTFQVERELTAFSGLAGFSRARIVSFQWLGEEILESSSGAALPVVSGTGRQMVLGHLLRKHAGDLSFFRSSAKQSGLASQLDLTFNELEREGYLPEDLLKTVESEADRGMIDKLRDLAKLYQLQRDFLGQDRLDPARRMEQVLEQLHQCKQFDDADVLIDNFFDFSSQERKLIAGLSQVCRQVDVTLTMSPDAPIIGNPHLLPGEMGLFRRTEETYRKLWFDLDQAHVQIDPPMKLYKALRYSNSQTLRHVEEHLMERRPAQLVEAHGVRLIQAFDRRGEVNAAARQIRQWMSEGLRYREIAVLVRSIDPYQDWIAAAFGEHDIPYFVDRRRPAAYHPLTQVARALVSAVVRKFNHDDMMILLKSGLAGISFVDADAIENYVLEHQVRNETWIADIAWKDALGLRDEDDDLPEANAGCDVDKLRRKLIAPLLQLRKGFLAQPTQTVKQYAAQLYHAISSMGTKASLEAWIETATKESDLEQAAEHQQVWSSLTDLLDQMVDLLDDEQASAEDFLTILESGLEDFDLALAPPTLDQVLVGDVDRTRTPDIKALIILGLSDGEFPRRPTESSIFSDRERASLDQRGISLDPASDKYLLDERFLAYVAFTRASDKLTVMRHGCNDAGGEQQASIFWQRIRATVPNVPVEIVSPEHQETLAQIGTRQQLARYLMTRVRAVQQAAELSDEDASLYQWLATDGRDAKVLKAWRSLSYRNDAHLSKLTAEALFPSPLVASVSRIEAFAACPFKHFTRYGLNLRPRDESEITPLRLGTIYHCVLEQYVRKLLAEYKDWSDAATPNIAQTLAELTNDISQQVIDTILLTNPRSTYLLNYVRETVHRVLLAQFEASKVGDVNPMGAELKFGFEKDSYPAMKMRTKKRRIVELRGKIDRVDIVGEEAFAIVDYKTKTQTLKLDRVLHGLALQLLTYLMVAHVHSRQLNPQRRRLAPAGALYYPIVRGFRSSKDPAAEPGPNEPDFHLKTKPRGAVVSTYITEFDELAGKGASKVISSFINKTGELGLRKTTDTLKPDEFTAVMREVRKIIKGLSDQIMDGHISVTPYRMGDETPCPNCAYRSVCRFDVSTHDTYLNKETENRETILNRLTGNEPASGGDDA